MDTIGLILAVEVHSAGIVDRNSAELVFEKAKDKYPRLTKIFGSAQNVRLNTHSMLPQTQVLKGVAANINYSLALHFYHYQIFLDAGYEGQDWHQEMLKKYGWQLEIVKRPFNNFITAQDVGLAPKTGFTVLKWRWVVERTFAWLSRWRRTSKDYEYLSSTSTNLIYAIMLRVMVSRLSRNGATTKETRYPVKP